MLSKSLVIFVGIGIISGLLFGIYLIDVKNTSQLVYVEGAGISVITEKFDFKKGEEIKITIINKTVYDRRHLWAYRGIRTRRIGCRACPIAACEA